eukprot:CAMPEP_0184333380 /NCGR_PEP_ID=MMETSP1089-20130417/2379_1 /TAXON_ID=38269 ORGANISM="Gloeochaete wittrockiana, Strain SAG46.84" /NCGR_SAMPLE_ID=MMETSP1089 /ASSEMBLY_ACC=CAM_ASM_000445 /LENGTH=144 /DNA_ID=CAMNT_0026657165 /DNA_START=45 /DNA_END=479 /DNA_ORIENTATION=+
MTFSAAKIMKLAKGLRYPNNVRYRCARDTVEKALQHSYKDRKIRKRTFRSQWIVQINAGVQQYGLSYSGFMNALVENDILLNRKMLAQLAQTEPYSFEALINVARPTIEAKKEQVKQYQLQQKLEKEKLDQKRKADRKNLTLFA